MSIEVKINIKIDGANEGASMILLIDAPVTTM